VKKVAAVLILCGVGLLVYGLLNFHATGTPSELAHATGWDVSYDAAARLEAAIGAVFLTAGCLLWRWNVR